MQYRQGDILIERITTIPRQAVTRTDPVLAHGEATGHCHTVDGAVALYERDGVLYLRVGSEGATVTHQEHATISLVAGVYQVTRQREYAPEAVRNVQD